MVLTSIVGFLHWRGTGYALFDQHSVLQTAKSGFPHVYNNSSLILAAHYSSASFIFRVEYIVHSSCHIHNKLHNLVLWLKFNSNETMGNIKFVHVLLPGQIYTFNSSFHSFQNYVSDISGFQGLP